MELSSAFSMRTGKLSHEPAFFFLLLIFCFPALKKGWYHLVIFQCCSLVGIATCSHKAEQRALSSSGSFQDCHGVGRSRPPSCTERKACSWHSTLTTPPASLALKFCVSCEAGGQPCSWEGSLPAPKSLHTLHVSLVLYENQDFCLGFLTVFCMLGLQSRFRALHMILLY